MCEAGKICIDFILMNFNPESLGAMIRERRRVLGLGQVDVAQLADISIHTLVNLETGKGNPSLRLATKVLEVLGMEIRLQVRTTTEAT